LPDGHTAGDAVVHFKNANVLHIGDLYISGQFPSVDYDHGGNVINLAHNLDTIIKIMPSDVKIVSGHLLNATVEDLKNYVTMLNSTVRIVQNEINKGKSLLEMQNGKILVDWEDWGKHVTTDMWIETIYRSLTDDTIQGEKR
jgi:glyoxylase-like metal-dependent hydrolase (beta-lactamase superfamily II)